MDKTSPNKPSQLTLAYRMVAKTPEGRMVLDDVLRVAGLFGTQFTGNSSTFFNLGKREVGMVVLKRLTGKASIEAEPFGKWLNSIMEGK